MLTLLLIGGIMKNIKRALFIAMLLTLAACVPAITYFLISPNAVKPENRENFIPEPPEGYELTLVFEDNFYGLGLDENKWSCEDNTPRRDGWWEKEAVSLDGQGNLVMTTYEEGGRFIDGCITSKGLINIMEQPYGYYTIRVKLHKEQGHWPAFWMMAGDVGSIENGGVDGAEIDIFEKPTLDNMVQQTIHWDGYDPKYHQSSTRKVFLNGVMEGWHTIGLLWTPEKYVYYIDGVKTWSHNYGGVCEKPGELIISDEIGTWGGDITKAALPDSFLVDYVRVYALKE
jgi:beta-glucanase (GH16 family)